MSKSLYELSAPPPPPIACILGFLQTWNHLEGMGGGAVFKMEEGRRQYFREWGGLHRGQGDLGMLGSCRSWVQ